MNIFPFHKSEKSLNEKNGFNKFTYIANMKGYL